MIARRLKISMFRALSEREKLLFLEAFLLHLWIGLLLKVIPFRWIPRFFRSPQSSVGSLRLRRRKSPAHEVSGRRLNPAHELVPMKSGVSGRKSEDIIMIKRAIERANVVSPWKNRCLVSALAARRMLVRRGIESQLSLGVAKITTGKTVAHAWLSARGQEIVPRGSGYTELYFF